MPVPMGFEWPLEAGTAGMRSTFLVRWLEERSREAAGSWWRARLEAGNDVFGSSRHTPGKRAEAREVSAGLDLSLGGIKKAGPPLLLVQDLSGGQSLDHAHLPLAFRTVPNGGFMSGKWCDSFRRRRYIEQSSANREQAASSPVGHPAEIADPRETFGRTCCKKRRRNSSR